MQILPLEARTARDIERSFGAMVRERSDAVIVAADYLFFEYRQQIADAALKYRLPSIFQQRETVELGGLMSYGQSLTELFRRAATYVDRILKGAKPSDLPVEQPNIFELAVNLKTARALGLTMPESMLARADLVIQ
jgi:putative ABC transport system substrate-binding protein